MEDFYINKFHEPVYIHKCKYFTYCGNRMERLHKKSSKGGFVCFSCRQEDIRRRARVAREKRLMATSS